MSNDEWTVEGNRVTDDRVLQRLRAMIESESDLIVEHRCYRRARSPHRFVCSNFADLEHYMKANVAAGDSFLFWRFADCCRDDNFVESGKVPDAKGQVPVGGAY